MKRRNFLAASVALSAAPLSALTAQIQKSDNQQQFIELVKYRLHIGDRKNRVADFYENVAIPAMNRNGIERVGVFNVLYGPNEPSLYVLIPHKSVDSVLTLQAGLSGDAEYVKAGVDFLNAPLSNSSYVRMESSLLLAFFHMPEVEAPVSLLENKSRIYEMRTYESHSRKMGKKKIEMFNEGGEIDIFRKTGLQPVFFAETIIGPLMPNLTYMLAFDSMESRNKQWDVFRQDPDWLKLSKDPQYKDTVSNITDIILRPLSCSQI
ncbi:NIPSNAP family protein [candidate division KSB1 bacterium]|nr:NIPSNAP family protein [candidate division KSB1 bacterium]